MITRADAKKLGEGPDARAFKELETKIDRAIELACAWSRWPARCNLQGHSGVAEMVAQAYRSSGWTVEIVLDARDGDFIQLEKP